MKAQIKIISFAIIVAISAACSSGGVKTEASEALNVKSSSFDAVYYADKNESTIEWEGYKPTGTHHGTINISKGKLEAKEGVLVGGEFTIDMQSIVVLDLTDPDKNKKLLGHLKSSDFFEAETFPTANFVLIDAKPLNGNEIDKSLEKGDLVPTHAITGNLTMKGITKSITFNALVEMDEKKVMAKTNQFFIDRAQWNVQYGSKSFFDDLKDNFINDEMGITITLVTIKGDDMAN
ncbi:MAG: YceI family protein [Bacteroidales bacterium]|nr:YceI family protein [Bacteroidales bacterium]